MLFLAHLLFYIYNGNYMQMKCWSEVAWNELSWKDKKDIVPKYFLIKT